MKLESPSYIVIKNQYALQAILMDLGLSVHESSAVVESLMTQIAEASWHLEVLKDTIPTSGARYADRGLWPYVEDDNHCPRELMIVSQGLFPDVIYVGQPRVRAMCAMSGFTMGRNYEISWELSHKSEHRYYVEIKRESNKIKIPLIEFLRPEYHDCFVFR